MNASTGLTLEEDTGNELTQTRGRRNKRGQQDPSPSSAPTKQPWKTLATKVIRKKKPPRKSMKDMMMKELCRKWNVRVRIGLQCGTTKGWLKKSEMKQTMQGQKLKRTHPGVWALHEIWHYQQCQTILIAVIPFQRLVREVCDDHKVRGSGLHWQSNTLFTLQGATEAYMSRFLHDINLCALHRWVKTIS